MLGAIRAKFLGRDECRVIVVGLEGSGKTTIVYRLKHGKLTDSEIIPTIGFNCECVEYHKMIFSLWDLGGSQDFRAFWRLYFKGTQAIIFVIDSSDLKRMDEARESMQTPIMHASTPPLKRSAARRRIAANSRKNSPPAAVVRMMSALW